MAESEEREKLVEVGRNAWRIERAQAFAPLVDGEEVFAAVRSSMIKARRRICILAWEFHSQAVMRRDGEDDGYPAELGPFLDALLEEREELEVFVLVWDYALIYVQEREWRIFSRWLKNPHPRLHFVEDESAPSGASHHQKVVTVDEAVAFCGGLDLSISRWDTNEHKLRDERRIDPDGKRYSPYHDVHAVLDGTAAEALRELVAERWRRGTGEPLPAMPEGGVKDAWPDGVGKPFEEVEVAFTRLFASASERPTEIEQMHLDLFAAARRHIFIENQYFSSQSMCRALAERLEEEDGPEVVLILPRQTSGWLVESTVGLLRDRLLEQLHEADRHGRLRTLAPEVSSDGETDYVYVHSKVVVVDDRILKIGSSNLSNRSLSVDSELDMTLEFEEADREVCHFRQRLLGMHWGLSREEWTELEEEEGGMLAALDKKGEGEGKESGHWLAPLSYGCESELQRKLADTQLLDPEDPIDPEFLLRKELGEDERPFVWRRALKILASIVAALVLGFGVYWAWGAFLDEKAAKDYLAMVKESAWAPVIVFLIFTLGGAMGVPLNFMLVTTAIVLGSRFAMLYGISGALVSSCIGFYMGNLLGKPLIRRFGSDSVEAVSRKLGERSFRSVAFIRLIPVAPFFIVNMVAGASHLKFKQYLIGTVLGMAPGMSAVVLLADRAEAAARDPRLENLLTLAAVLAAIVGAVIYLRHALGGESVGEKDDE